MKTIKTKILVLIAFVMVLSFTACSSGNDISGGGNTPTSSPTLSQNGTTDLTKTQDPTNTPDENGGITTDNTLGVQEIISDPATPIDTASTPGSSLDEFANALGFMPEFILQDDVLDWGDIPDWGEPLESAGIKKGTYLIDLSGRDADEFIQAAADAGFFGVENPDAMTQGTYCLFEEPVVNLDPNYEYRNRPFLLIMS